MSEKALFYEAELRIEIVYEPLIGDDIRDVAERAVHAFWNKGTGCPNIRLVIPDFNGVRITLERAKTAKAPAE